jgi:hypothetical protein
MVQEEEVVNRDQEWAIACDHGAMIGEMDEVGASGRARDHDLLVDVSTDPVHRGSAGHDVSHAGGRAAGRSAAEGQKPTFLWKGIRQEPAYVACDAPDAGVSDAVYRQEDLHQESLARVPSST